MYDHQSELRAAAHAALVKQGYEIVEDRYAGARITLRKDGNTIATAVRTSVNRWVGWMRTATGDWRALADAEIIVVATFDDETRPSKIQVYCFRQSDIRSSFDERLETRTAKNPKLSKKAPVFICLDPYKDRSRGVNVKAKALWSLDLALGIGPASVERPAEKNHDIEPGLTISAAKQGLAKTYGVSTEAIEIIIRG